MPNFENAARLFGLPAVQLSHPQIIQLKTCIKLEWITKDTFFSPRQNRTIQQNLKEAVSLLPLCPIALDQTLRVLFSNYPILSVFCFFSPQKQMYENRFIILRKLHISKKPFCFWEEEISIMHLKISHIFSYSINKTECKKSPWNRGETAKAGHKKKLDNVFGISVILPVFSEYFFTSNTLTIPRLPEACFFFFFVGFSHQWVRHSSGTWILGK